VGGGLLNAKKNLTVAPGGNIAMSNANDVVSVKGDFIVNTASNITLNNGLLDLKGDLAINTAVWFTTGANLHAQFSGTPGQQQIRYPAGGGASFGKLAVPGLDPRHLNVARGPQNFYIDCTNDYCHNPACTFMYCGGPHVLPALTCANCAMQAECSVNKIWTNLSGEIYDAALATGAFTPYYIVGCANGDMLTSDNSSLSYSRFELPYYTIMNTMRQWNFIAIGGGRYLVQSASNTGLYLTADPASHGVSPAVLSNAGADSNQHWRIAVLGDGKALASASADTNIAGHRLTGSMSLSETAYIPVDFLDAETYVPATGISIDDFDVVAGQSRHVPAPAFTPSNAFGGTGSAWFTYTPSNPHNYNVSIDADGLCTAGTNIDAITYTAENKITSVSTAFTVSVVTLPHPDAQNKSQWCWAAAAKMVGENNSGGSGALNTGIAILVTESGIHSYGGVNFFGRRPNPPNPQYTVDAGQFQIVVAVHSDDRNEGGDNDAKETGVRLALLNNMLVGSLGSRSGVTATDIYWMNDELANDRWVIANVFRNSDWSGHSVVVKSMSNNGATDVYEYWDPWTNEESQFTSAQIATKTIQLTDDPENRTLAWIQLCTY
jgi:hypothetical protein